jgi:hypothetical protein
MSRTRKVLIVAGIWLGVGLVVALALVSGAGAKPYPPSTTVPATTLPPPTTTLCNYSYKNCQPAEPPTTTTIPRPVVRHLTVAPPPPPPIAARPRTAG